MSTAKSKSQTKGLRFYLRIFSILFFLGLLGTIGVLVIPRSLPVPVDGRKADDFCLQDPRNQEMVTLSDLLKKKKQSSSSSWAPNVCSTINTFPS